MSNRPRIKIEKDKIDKVVFFITIIFLILLIVFNFWIYKNSPQIIPAHFGTDGNPNRYSDKSILFIMPAIALVIFLLLNTLVRYPELYNYPQSITEENAPAYYRKGIKMMRFLNLGIMLLFLGIEFEMFRGIKDKYLPFHWWQLAAVLLVTIALPVFIAWKAFPVKKIK